MRRCMQGNKNVWHIHYGEGTWNVTMYGWLRLTIKISYVSLTYGVRLLSVASNFKRTRLCLIKKFWN